MDLIHLVWVTDYRILGARYGAGIVLPTVINAHADGSVSAADRALFAKSDISGLGDAYLSPVLLNWKVGNNDLTFAPGIIAPTGRYREDRLLNTGRNYWAFDLAGSWTWLHPTGGHEVSISAGVLFNERNHDTDYRTGDEFHLDALVGQYFPRPLVSASWGITTSNLRAMMET